MHLIYVTAAMPLSFDETFIVPEILELQRCGHCVTVVPIRPLRPIFHESSRRLTTIAKPVLSLLIITYALAEIVRAPLRAFRAALQLTASRDIRVLVKNVAVFPKGLWLARVARLQGVDHIHAHWAGTSATAALVASIVSEIPWSFTAHRWDIAENNLLYKKTQTAKFVRTIDAQGAHEIAPFMGPNRHKLRVIHMGVDLHTPAPGTYGTQQRPLRVLVGARFVEVKGHRYALEAIAKLKAARVEVSLHCAGHGPLMSRMEKYARELGVLDCVEFLGFLEHQELLSRLRDQTWDVALLPSIETRMYKEGIPVFLIEAMAAGVPVVGTNTGGIPELLDRGAGILIPERDAGAIAEALTTLSLDSNLRLQLADAGLRRVRDHFAIESTVVALLDEISSGNYGRCHHHLKNMEAI